jgi:hypothetical protein
MNVALSVPSVKHYFICATQMYEKWHNCSPNARFIRPATRNTCPKYRRTCSTSHLFPTKPNRPRTKPAQNSTDPPQITTNPPRSTPTPPHFCPRSRSPHHNTRCTYTLLPIFCRLLATTFRLPSPHLPKLPTWLGGI